MKAGLHLLRWDVRRFRALLAVWLLLIVANATLDGVWPILAVDLVSRQIAGLLGNLLWLAELLLSFVLVALVVQADPLVGTNAFWTTRPIPPGRLLASKLVLLATVMIAFPVVADAVLMIAYRVPAGEIVAVTAQNVIFWGLWVVLIAAAAAITPSLAQFSLFVGGALVTMAGVVATMLAFAIYQSNDSPPMAGSDALHDPSSGMIGTVLLIISALAFLATQYRTRMRIRSIAVGLAGLAIAYIGASVWPWSFLAPKAEIPEWAEQPSMLRLSADADTVYLDHSEFANPQQSLEWWQAHAKIRMSGIEPGWSATIGVQDAAVHLDGNTSLTSRVSAQSVSVPIDNAEAVQDAAVLRQLLNVGRVMDEVPYERHQWPVVLFLRDAELRRLPTADGAYDGRFRVSLTRHEIEATLPLQRGAAHQNGAYHFSIERVQPQANRVSIVARESNASSVFDRRERVRFRFYLRNRQAAEAIQGGGYDLRSEVSLMRVLPFAVGVSTEGDLGFRPGAVTIDFQPGRGPQGQPTPLDRQWFEHAELVIVRSTQAGAVERRLAIADFPVRVQ
jgi:hypothetical protein